MHPVISFNRTPHLNGSDRLAADPYDLLPQTSSPNSCAWRVLSVGGKNDDALMREALSPPSRFSFSHANDYRDLWSLSKANTYDAVIFHNNLCCFELQEAARLVRRRWPSAKILLIRSGEILLDDPLYDLRLRPPVDPNTVIAILSGRGRLTTEDSRPMAGWHVP